MATFRRKRLWIDAHVQGSLIRRVVIYWLACVGTVELLTLSWQIITGPEQPTYFDYFLEYDWRSACVRLMISAAVLAPIILDMLRLSNRFAGPVYRMQRALRQIADGAPITRVTLRKNDYWHGFADELNAALDRLSDQPAIQPHRTCSDGVADSLTATPPVAGDFDRWLTAN
jgi:hypothetical protein